jgi:hypothetical protein
MIIRSLLLLGLLLPLAPAQDASPAPASAPVLIEGLAENVYRRVAMMKGMKRTDEPTARILANLIMADDRIDEAEARLIAELTKEKFSLLLRPGPGKSYQPAEVLFAASLTPGARAALREAGPLDFQAVLAKPDAAGLAKLAGWLNASTERRAKARAWLAERAEAERAREPRHANGEWGHYRVFVNALYESLKSVPGADGQTLRRWAFEALLLHDRQQGDAVPDFLYAYFLDGTAEWQAKQDATKAIDAIAPLPAKP